MGIEVFGMPLSTLLIFGGVSVAILAVLTVWGMVYDPEKYESKR